MFGVNECVSCGQKMEDFNHKCRRRHEAGRKAAQTNHYDAVIRTPTMGERLTIGFMLLQEDEWRSKE